MSSREPRTVRVDTDVWENFGQFVIETKGQKHGHMGQLVERALVEYMDNDRTARVEEKVDANAEKLDTLLSELDGTHTHKKSDAVEKLQSIVADLEGEGPVIPEDRVRRSIELVAGIDDRTIDKHMNQLQRQGYAYKHPGNSAVWTLDKTEWIGWADSCIDNNPTLELHDVIEPYPITHDEYIEAVESEGLVAHA